jgi:hypothetical protein
MTKKISISLPDDVAERLEGKANVSAYVTSTLQWQYAREDTERMHLMAGIVATDEERAEARERMRARLAAARARCTPEYFAEMRRRHGFDTA